MGRGESQERCRIGRAAAEDPAPGTRCHRQGGKRPRRSAAPVRCAYRTFGGPDFGFARAGLLMSKVQAIRAEAQLSPRARLAAEIKQYGKLEDAIAAAAGAI